MLEVRGCVGRSILNHRRAQKGYKATQLPTTNHLLLITKSVLSLTSQITPNHTPLALLFKTATMKFITSSSALLLVLASIVSGTTVATVKSDVSAIDTAVTSLNQQLQATSLNYFSALAINSAANSLDDKIKTATTDVQDLTETPTDADANEIISTLTGTEKNVKSATDRLIVLKPQFENLGVAGIAKGDIDSLKTDTAAFGAALVKVAPAAEKEAAQDLADEFNADLANAAAAYN